MSKWIQEEGLVMKKIQLVLVSLFISTGLVASSSAAINSVGDPGRSWAQPDDADLGLHVQQFMDTGQHEVPSYLVIGSQMLDAKDDPTCSSLNEEKCRAETLEFSAVLPRCTSEADINCTVDVGTITEAGVKTSALFSRYFPEKAQNQFEGSAERNLPAGVAGSIYSLPSALHDGGDKYYLSAVLRGRVTPNNSAEPSGLEVQMTPVAFETSGYFSQSKQQLDAGWAKITDRNTGRVRWGIQSSGYSGTQYCVANSWRENLCAQKYAFPAETRFYVTIRIGKVPGGWMHGRISVPDIEITAGTKYSTIEFRGNPIAVPTVYKMYRYPEMPEPLKQWYDVERGGYKPACAGNPGICAGGRSGPSNDPLNRNVIISPDPWDPYGMEQLKLWIPYIGDKATALPSFWSVRTLSEYEMQNAGQCFKDNSKITGIVSTNSTQYSAGPPTFDKAEGTLSYQVAAPHYGTNGDVFKGSYDLVMRSEVARCVYGFSKAPIQATLAITSADGTQQVATTVIGERDGWLYLRAKNFEFSAPVIKAKLTQEAPAVEPTPTPTPTPSTTAVAKAKKTITCVKGKTTKKVSGSNPKCPAGYKKKG
jgi:hypothetical protein